MASRAAPAAILLMLLPALTGCIAGELGPASTRAPVDDLLSPVRFEIGDPKKTWIPASSDDAKLFSKLWLPETDPVDPGWKAPLILVMTPYQGYDGREDETDAASRPSSPDYVWLIDHFVPRGYAVAFLDVRGTGESGGCLEQTGEKQRQDGYDAVEWFAEQPWSNGEVGMYGRSYRAEAQLGTAALAPPHLTTIVPVSSVAGQYEWNYYDGVPFTLHTLMGNAAYLATEGAHPSTEPQGLVQYPDRFTCQGEILTMDATHTGDWNAYWEERELRNLVGDMEGTSVLYTHGLQDWNVRPVAIRDMWEHIPTEKRLILGQWSHAFPDNGYGDEPAREDWRTIVHLWYDHFLLGSENGILDRLPAVQVQDSSLVWRVEETFPPIDASDLALHLSPDNRMLAAPTTWEAPLLLRENEEAFARNETGLPVPDVDTGEVATELAFQTEPLVSPLHISGWPALTLDILLFDGLYPDPDTETDAHFAANLYVVGPGGERTWVNSGYTSARHLHGLDAPQPVPEDQRIVYSLTMHPQDTVVPSGARLELVLSGSDRWTEPQGTFWGAELWGGTLTLPAIDGTSGGTALETPLVEPVVTPAAR